MNALTGLLLVALGVVMGNPIGYAWCRWEERDERKRVRDNIRRIREQEQALVAEIAELDRENAELRDYLAWERQLEDGAA